MSQEIWSSINPDTTSGLMLAGLLDDFKDALMSGCSGTARPANLRAGGMWVDTTNQASPNYYWSFNMYNGTTDVEIFRISVLNGFGGTLTADGSFTIQEIAADAVGPILQMIKNRIASNGEVLDGDTVAEIRWTGRTFTGTDPTVAYLKWTATDNQVTNYGGTLSLYSTPDGTSSLTEHLRCIGGYLETVVPHKLTSLQVVSQDVATAASITQLSAAYARVEMTGATATNILGINSSHASKVIAIHNRSTAYVYLKHQHSTAAAADRLKLPGSVDKFIAPQDTITLFYCTTDSRWKIQEANNHKLVRTIETLNGAYQSWTAPSGTTRVRITAYPQPSSKFFSNRFIDPYGNMYAYGTNQFGGLGLGDVIPRSSPVAVLGGLFFNPITKSTGAQTVAYGFATSGQLYAWGQADTGILGDGTVVAKSSPVAVVGPATAWAGFHTRGAGFAFGFAESGAVYAWGYNANGNLAVGDTTNRSSPTLVLGGLKFSRIFGSNDANNSVFGITTAGVLYGWGHNGNGQLGVGDVVPRSSPVAVLGGLTFKKIISTQTLNTRSSVLGLTTSGALYGWGANEHGELGVGNTTPRSSPVAVLGGITFLDIFETTFASICAITSTGTLYAWGYNADGNLGLGDVVPRSSPVAVLGGLTFSKAFMFNQSVYAITAAGAAYAWGANDVGQLGVGDRTSRSSPVAVLGGLRFNTIEIFGKAVWGATSGGEVYAWGTNTNGQLAVGDVTNRSSPVAIVGAASVGPDLPMLSMEIAVDPGTAYDVILSQGRSTFGSNSIGYGVDRITIAYDS